MMEQQEENNHTLTVNSTVLYSMLHSHLRKPASKAQKDQQDVGILDLLLRNISPTYCISRPFT